MPGLRNYDAGSGGNFRKGMGMGLGMIFGCGGVLVLVVAALLFLTGTVGNGCLDRARDAARRQEQRDRERVERNRREEDEARKREGK